MSNIENNNVSLSDLSNGAIPTAAPSVNHELPPGARPISAPLPKLKVNDVKPVDVSKVVRPKDADIPQEGLGQPLVDKAFKSLDEATERLRQESLDAIKKGEEERAEKEFLEDDDTDILDSDGTVAPSTTIPNQPAISDNNGLAIPEDDDDNLFDEEDDVVLKAKPTITTNDIPKTTFIKNETAEVSDEEREDLSILDAEPVEEDPEDPELIEEAKKIQNDVLNTIQNEYDKNFTYLNDKVDLTKFVVANKPISASKVLSHITKAEVNKADGVVYALKRAIRMSAFSAVEIATILDPEAIKNKGLSATEAIVEKFKLIYNHLEDANKPKTFEEWAKLTPRDAISDYFFTAYKATFGRSNIITYRCVDDDCPSIFMRHKSTEDMIKFKDDATKEEYYNILRTGNVNTSSHDYQTDIFQISDDYVVALRQPSIYNSLIEPSYLDKDFYTKYSDFLLLISYIDNIYVIDRGSGRLIPIDTKPDRFDMAKTAKRKIKTYASIIRSLTSDQLQVLMVESDKYDPGEYDDDGNVIVDIQYIYPSEKCEKCGKEIPEEVTSPEAMLFTRHQLGRYYQISKK